jgi:hypothetical protein
MAYASIKCRGGGALFGTTGITQNPNHAMALATPLCTYENCHDVAELPTVIAACFIGHIGNIEV